MNFFIKDISQITLIVFKNLVLRLCTKWASNAMQSNAMNNLFSTVGKDLADKIDPAPNPLLSGAFEVNRQKLKFCFRTTEVQEIRDAFDAVKIAKSFGTDNISSYFLKFALYFIENSLAISFDIFLETNQFPVAWKIVRVNAIFKDGERTEKSNYRPISVLPVISRLFFEKLVTKQLNQTVSFLMTSQAFCAFGLQ